jgi:hypothetical protein
MDWLSAGAGGLGAGLFGGNSAADSANKYLDQIPGMEKGYYNPFIQHGEDAYGKFNPITSSMLTDPAGFLESMMKGYQPSRGFQLKNDQMLRTAGNTAAAGGMRGSMQNIGNSAKITDMLMGDDMQQWLQNVMGIQGRGLNSQEHLYDTGFDATKNLTGDLSNVLGTQGTLNFYDTTNRNKEKQDMLMGILKMAGGAAGGGGFA